MQLASLNSLCPTATLVHVFTPRINAGTKPKLGVILSGVPDCAIIRLLDESDHKAFGIQVGENIALPVYDYATWAQADANARAELLANDGAYALVWAPTSRSGSPAFVRSPQ